VVKGIHFDHFGVGGEMQGSRLVPHT